MARGFRPVVRDQEFLLPPNMADWLSDDHVVWFLLEVVAELDLSVFYRRAALRRDGQPARGSAGRAAFDPGMLLTLLIYGYACGERSSRRIERLCHTDIAFRLICAGDVPDHSVLARFRQHHAQAFAGLFTQVLGLCREAGLARLGTVAIDGTKIAANASRLANRSRAWLDTEAAKLDRQTPDRQTPDRQAADRERVEQVLAEAAAVDAAEDSEYGAARGDELPSGWSGRSGRRERIRAAKARLDAAGQARRDTEEAAAAGRAEQDTKAVVVAEQALAQEMATRSADAAAWEAAWEHAATHPGAPLPRGRAPVPPEQSAVVKRARDRVAKARYRVEHPDTAPRPGRPGSRPDGTSAQDRSGQDRSGQDRSGQDRSAQVNVTDPDSTIMPSRNGWVQGYNTQFAVTADQIILATQVSTSPVDVLSYQPMVSATQDAARLLGATAELGILLLDAGYASNATLTAPGPDRLIALGKTRSVQAAARDHPATGAPPPGATPRQVMDHRLRTPEGARLYKRRGATVEPGIGNFKKLLDRYSRRGLPAVVSETHLAAAVFNLLKIHRAGHHAAPA